MKPFHNSDKTLNGRDLMFAFPSVIIGVSILSLPSEVAKVTLFSDGWISILIAGVIFTLLAIFAIRIAMHFPDQPFLDYASYLVTKPVAIVISLLYVVSSIFFSAHATRSLAYIAQIFLFDRTPLPVIALAFLLVVVYAVAGSRVGIFRLNILFLPIILFVFLFVGVFNIPRFEPINFLPQLQTSFQGYMTGILKTIPAFNGFAIGLFYMFFIKQEKPPTKQAIIGMSISTFFYIFIFIISIGVFGNIVTSNLMYPTLDLAKRVDLPGAIFERIDAFVYTIWIMAIFNTVTIFLDVAVLLLTSIFKKAKKQILLFMLAPIIFFIGMFPREIYQLNEMMSVIGNIGILITLVVLLCFYIMIKIKRRTMNDQA